MYSANPHTDHPSEVLTHGARLANVIRNWAWALSESDRSGNMDPEDFDGVTTIALALEATLKEAEKHVQQDCACFKNAKATEIKRWAWPLTRDTLRTRQT